MSSTAFSITTDYCWNGEEGDGNTACIDGDAEKYFPSIVVLDPFSGSNIQSVFAPVGAEEYPSLGGQELSSPLELDSTGTDPLNIPYVIIAVTEVGTRDELGINRREIPLGLGLTLLFSFLKLSELQGESFFFRVKIFPIRRIPIIQHLPLPVEHFISLTQVE